LNLLDIAEMDALLRRNRGSRGAERLKDALSAYRDPAFTKSGLERRFLQLVRDACLPRPTSNLFIAGYELDAYWPAERFAVELDTYEYHGGRRAFEADRMRQESLKLAGIEMIRITGKRIEREPNAVVHRLRELLDRRRHELVDLPASGLPVG
jgi:very-short-patch-repair endonuclease